MQAPTAKSFVLYYPDSCIMFNMVQCSRVKKKSSNCSANEDDGGSSAAAEAISELWVNDDKLRLVLRLLKSDKLPWLVSHYGSREIMKAPLVIPIRDDDVEGNKVAIWLRDFAGRGENCIKRKFYLEFPSGIDADIFRYSHNKMLNDHLATKDKGTNQKLTENIRKENDERPPAKRARIAIENDEEKYEEVVNKFHIGDDHDFLDDCFPETQNRHGDY